jgi:hypothetical protein
MSIPEHRDIHQAASALGPEGARAVRAAEIFGAWTKTHCPTWLITAIEQIWALHTDDLQPRTQLGHPAMADPCGTASGLPYRLQLIGKFYDDPTLLRVGYAYQESIGWEDLLAL